VVLLFASGCQLFDYLFYNAPGVAPGDLAGFTGTTPANKDAALSAAGGTAMSSVGGAAVAITTDPGFITGAAAKTIVVSPAAADLLAQIPSFKSFSAQIQKLAGKSVTLTQTVSSDDTNVAIHLDVKDETTNDIYSAGTMTIDWLKFDLTGSRTAVTPPYSANGSFNLDSKITMDGYQTSPAVVVNEGIVNFIAKGSLSATLDSQGKATSLNYSISASLVAGFSISGGNGNSGKFIIEAMYIDGAALTEAQLQDPATVSGSLKIDIVVRVYDNSNTLVDTYQYTQDDIQTMIAAAQ
jgi:hypothetical protein